MKVKEIIAALEKVQDKEKLVTFKSKYLDKKWLTILEVKESGNIVQLSQ